MKERNSSVPTISNAYTSTSHQSNAVTTLILRDFSLGLNGKSVRIANSHCRNPAAKSWIGLNLS